MIRFKKNEMKWNKIYYFPLFQTNKKKWIFQFSQKKNFNLTEIKENVRKKWRFEGKLNGIR